MASSANLNGAITDYAIGFTRKQVSGLADACNKDLQGDLAQLRALLDQVDQKRQKYQEGKSSFLQELRTSLTSLHVDAAVVDTALSDIAATPSPSLLSAIPTSATLHLDSLLLTPAASPPDSGSTETTQKPQQPEAVGSDAATDLVNGSKETPGESSKSAMPSVSQALEKRQGSESDNVKSSISPSALVPDLVIHRQKRPLETPEDTAQEPKKAKTSPTDASNVFIYSSVSKFTNRYSKMPTQPVVKETPRKLRIQDLDAIECVFRHENRVGFFVIRCNDPECSLRISDSMPFKYKRAFNHFNSKHLQQPQSEEFIFNEFAFQIEDATEEAIAARYNDSEIQKCSPKNTVHDTRIMPSQSESPRRASKAVSFDLERSPSLGYQDSGFPKASDSDNGFGPSDVNEGDLESTSLEQKKTRHNLRQLPRLSYTQMVHGRDPTPPDSQDQTDDDRTESSIAKRNGTTNSSSISTRGSKSVRKLLRLGEKPRRASEQSQSNKPFGHTGEWARRSAPS